MQTARCLVTLFAVAVASVMALPTTPVCSAPELSPYDKCVKEHGGNAQFPYPGPGECQILGHCECLEDGSIGCVC
ncbi:hypothetical protein H4S00_000995 [Coemansia sp. D1744]|nr:hypothetical protein H4S00_000995 [Coemansia sp. D1744]